MKWYQPGKYSLMNWRILIIILPQRAILYRTAELPWTGNEARRVDHMRAHPKASLAPARGSILIIGWGHKEKAVYPWGVLVGAQGTLKFKLHLAQIQWLTKLSQCLVLLDYSLNSFECKTYINKVLVHQRKNLIRAMQPSRNYVIPIRGDEDMGNSNQGPIDSVLWDGIRTIRIWYSIYYIICNPW